MKTSYLFALSALLITGCSRSINIYVPNQANVPLLKEKHEVKANISFSDWQAAYAITDNIAVMASGQHLARGLFYQDSEGDGDGLIDEYTRGGLIEGGVGFFKALDSKKRAVFDVYAGYGNGRFKTLDEFYYDDQELPRNNFLLRTRFHKFFVQPSFGVSHKVVEAAFAPRISLVNFYDQYIGPNAFENNPEEKTNFMRMNNKTVAFFEPTFTIRVGYRYVKWHMQLLFSTPLQDGAYSDNDGMGRYFQPVALNSGVSLNFGQWVRDAHR